MDPIHSLSRRANRPRLWLISAISLCAAYFATASVWRLATDQPDLRYAPDQPLESKPVKHEGDSHYPGCSNVAGADKVMVVLKTGATEVYGKLPMHLTTLFRCTPHYLLFSDLAQNISDYRIYDALEYVRPETKDSHEDFRLYWELQRYQREGLDISALGGDEGWKLDKWKFLPMLHEAYRLSPPTVDWFVFIEADTTLSWLNLLQWLNSLDPASAFYAGAQNNLGLTSFAHGGSGIILSRTAIRKLEELRDGMGAGAYDKKWEDIVHSTCCGDVSLALALADADVFLTPSWPHMQGETIPTLDWTKKHWCMPAVTWHHVTPAQIDSMWQFEVSWIAKRGWDAPYLFRDVFDHYVQRHISVNRTQWDNISRDVRYSNLAGDETKFGALLEYEKRSVDDFDMCAQACRMKQECLQWMWRSGDCRLGFDIRLGSIDKSGQETWSSGWMQDRIESMRAELEPCLI